MGDGTDSAQSHSEDLKILMVWGLVGSSLPAAEVRLIVVKPGGPATVAVEKLALANPGKLIIINNN